MPSAVMKDVHHWPLGTFRIFGVVVRIVGIFGGREEGDVVPTPGACPGFQLLRRRLGHHGEVEHGCDVWCAAVQKIEERIACWGSPFA